MNKSTIILAHSALFPEGKISKDKVIVINNKTNIITDVANYSAWQKKNPKAAIDEEISEDCLVAPAFVETHFHGFRGIDISEVKNTKQIHQLLKCQAEMGVGTCFLTMVALDNETTYKILALIYKAYLEQQIKPNLCEAKIAGIHLEAKFANLSKCGALKPSNMSAADIGLFCSFQQAAGNLIKIVTLSAVSDPNLHEHPLTRQHFIQQLAKMGVAISIGHSEGSVHDWHNVVRWMNAAATTSKQPNFLRVTHFTNAFTKPAKLQQIIAGKRRINLSELPKDTLCDGILTTKTSKREVFLELIVDNEHIPPKAMQWLLKEIAKNPSLKIVLVTDSIQAAGYNYNCLTTLGDSVVVVLNGFARVLHNWQDFFTPNELNKYQRNPARFNKFLAANPEFVATCLKAHLAGSLLTMPEAVKNMARYVGLAKALQMATENAAKSVGLNDVGRIAVGCKALFTVLPRKVNCL